MYIKRDKRWIIERREENGKNVEFKVRKTIDGNYHISPLREIIKRIEDGTSIYYVGKSDTLVEVVNSEDKYIRSVLNDNKGDNIDDLPTYK